MKVSGVGLGAFFLGKFAPKKEEQSSTGSFEKIQPNELIFANSKIELKASPIEGIVDIVDARTKKLVNNLVVLVSWADEEGRVHYNNSEIQAAPISITREGKPLLIYGFVSSETRPAQQPASGLIVELRFSDKEGDIAIHPQVRGNPNNLNDVKIGIGCFFGINQGVNRARILREGREQEVLPNPDSDTSPRQLGEFETFETSQCFTLRSAYPDMPALSLSLDPALGSYGRVDIESRNVPYNPEHQGLHENYIRQTGRPEWIEAGILYAPENQTFLLSLN